MEKNNRVVTKILLGMQLFLTNSVMNSMAYQFARDDISYRVKNIEHVPASETSRMLSIADRFEAREKKLTNLVPFEFVFSGNLFEYISTIHTNSGYINPAVTVRASF